MDFLQNIGAKIASFGFDEWSAVVFVLFLSLFLYSKREQIKVQSLIPKLIYVAMYQMDFGINFMKKISTKHRKFVQRFGYLSVVIGYIGMVLIIVMFLFSSYLLIEMVFVKEDVKGQGAALILPFVDNPLIGKISFWHFLICLFVLALIHEFAHGVVAKAHDIRIKKTGFGVLSLIVPIVPLAFVEPDEKEMEKIEPKKQISILAAGPTINIIFGILMAAIWFFLIFNVNDNFATPSGVPLMILNDSYPAGQAGMINKTVITEINGKEVKYYSDFHNEITNMSAGDNIILVANGTTYEFTTTAHPDDPSKAFIGIVPFDTFYVKKEGVSDLDIGIYIWFRRLIGLLGLLNILVGLMNLLPLPMVDGGRIFYLTLNKFTKDEKLSQKIFSKVGLFFFGLLIIALVLNYLGNPFLWFQ